MLMKKGNIVMFPSKEETVAIISPEDETVQTFRKGSIVFNPDTEPSLHMVQDGEIYNPKMGYQKVNLFLLVDDFLEDGDFTFDGNGEDIISLYKKDSNDYGAKLVACTDRQYRLPKLSKKFLVRYVEKQGINDVFVIYEEISDKLIPKVNRNNVISIRKAKDTFTGVEVAAILKDLVDKIYNNDKYAEAIEWINEKV